MSPTAQGHRNAAGRLLLTTLLLFAFVGGARAINTLTIEGYGEEEGRYYLIASPVVGEVDPENIGSMLNGEYDLYSFDQNGDEGLEWRNYKSEQFELEPGKGYLYANTENVTLTFTGSPFEDDYSIEVHEGWNLLGNPFNCPVSLDVEDFYVMNQDGTGLVKGEGTIGPMEGFFYYSWEDADYVTLVKVEEQSGTGGEGELEDIVLPPHGEWDNQDADPEQDPDPDMIVQTIALSAGWNWVSFYVNITLDELKAALLEALPNSNTPNTNITINSQSGSTTYSRGRWREQLYSLDLSQMYQIKVDDYCEITLEGMPIDPAEHPATIKNGDNWIAFPLSHTMSVTDAFAGFAVAGDMVISQTAFAFYTGSEWRGTLTTLEPGQGYIYYSNVEEDRIFVFPEAQSEAEGDDNNNLYEKHWPDFYLYDFPYNKPFVAAIMIDGQIITAEDENWDALEVAPFVGDEYRGNSMFLTDEYVKEYGDLFPILDGLAIYYNDPGEEVSFKMYDHSTRVLYEDCEVLCLGVQTTILIGEDYLEEYWDPENPIILSFTTPPFDGLVLSDLDDEEKNTDLISALIEENEGESVTTNVKLAGRTLWKNDQWNTICLPFDVTVEDSEFQNATVMELDTDNEYEGHVTGFEGGSLYLNFKDVTDLMAAGKPYIVKWEEEDDLIDDPIFYDVTIQNVDPADEDYVVTSADEKVTFKGIFSAMEIDGEDKTKLYLSKDEEDEEVKLFYPNNAMTIGAFRAYFQLNGIEAGDVSEARLYFGGSEASGIKDVQRSTMNVQREDAWFTLDGLKRQGKPTGKGLYLHGNRKVVIK
jgi:hypothetical protein